MRLRVRNSSEDTIHRYLSTIRDFLAVVGAKDAYTKADFDLYMEALVKRQTGGTYRHYVHYCLKTFYKLMNFKLKLERSDIPKMDEPVRRWYRFEEMVKIMDAAKNVSVRDWLIFRIFPLTMSRRKSISLLSRTDYDPKAGTLMMPSLKHGRRIQVELDPDTRAALNKYLLWRTDQYLALLPSSRPGNRQGLLTPHQVGMLLVKYAKLAGVENKGIHAFRRGMVTYYSRQGLNVKEIMGLSDWKSERSVIAYIQLDPDFATQTRRALNPLFNREVNLERPPSQV